MWIDGSIYVTLPGHASPTYLYILYTIHQTNNHVKLSSTDEDDTDAPREYRRNNNDVLADQRLSTKYSPSMPPCHHKAARHETDKRLIGHYISNGYMVDCTWYSWNGSAPDYTNQR